MKLHDQWLHKTSAPQAENWNGHGGKFAQVRSPPGSIWSLDRWLQDGDTVFFWVELVFQHILDHVIQHRQYQILIEVISRHPNPHRNTERTGRP
jgi:hypothetical protein